MGNSNEVVAKYVSEEEYNELLRREKHRKKKQAELLFKQKLYPIIQSREKQINHLYYYYKNIEGHRGEEWDCNEYELNYLYKFKWYDTYELVRDTGYLGRIYRIAMINYIYKWYDNYKKI